jgi:hypothetical protein
MTASLIVGTLRTLAESTRDPAEILLALNRRLLGLTQGDFATCLVLRINANGDASWPTPDTSRLPGRAGSESYRTFSAGALLRRDL